ncbi:MAG TPA: nucleotide exchange factor GrpE [Candidatus Cloacimonadota bacterium]|nr:nucleotide exchange factor GrpE [Candidatus Cloacimonadota bacterium]HPT72716.1 nucleotide exchange factor GrpE [Candidatus Cloacimonadota bacterium]
MSKSKHRCEEEQIENPEVTEQETTVDIETQLNELQQQVEQWKDKYMRCMADFDNYRRQMALKQKDWAFQATEKLVLSLCDVADNFERAMMQLNDSQKEDPVIKGILQIEKQLLSVLEKEDVEKIDALNQDFDPNVHEALAHIPSEMEEDKVVAIIQNGYKMKGKLLRAVRVAVSNGEKPSNSENNKNKDKDGGNNV